MKIPDKFGLPPKFRSKVKLNIFFIILFVLTVFAGVPILILTDQSFSNLDQSKEILKKTIDETVKEQTSRLYKTQAEGLSKRITDFLHTCEADLNDLSSLPHSPELYLKFSHNNVKYVNSLGRDVPLYKEIALVDESGKEIIKVADNKLAPSDHLKDISKPQNTRYLSETYFSDTKNNPYDVYVSHLASWYVSRQEQLDQGKQLDGVIRFNKKLKTRDGKFAGICTIALDAVHLLDFIGYKDVSRESIVNSYKTGSYNYLVDDQGWIIAHQKLWDIKGFDREGKAEDAFSENTPKWKYDAGVIPINLLHMDWRLKDYNTQEPMSSVIERVRRGETVITTMKSMGIHNETDGIIRTRAYAPIFYSTGPYNKYGLFGISMVGTSLRDFNDNSEILAGQLNEINSESKERIYFLAILIFIAVLIFSYLIARWIANPMNKLASMLVGIGKGEYKVSGINSPIEEVKVLSSEVVGLAGELEEKENKINRYVKDVELVNEKLAQAKKELSSYWHHEYEVESDTILEERIKLYEEEHPALRELRKDKCIGVSPSFLRVLRLVVPQSQMNIPTWIYGESGVGKSSLAYVIHALSPRADKPFFVFGASEFAAADPLIVLGKLFGYGPGHGITGIDKDGQPGILEECDGGTLLIDDVESLPMDTQSQLLRVIDGLDFHYAAGKSKSINVDVRFLFASNANLEQCVKEGHFRKDLYRRIGGSFNKIEIPPLRKRKADVTMIANYFVEKFAAKYNTNFKLTDGALSLLFKHKYKEGNIGELKTLIEIACESSRIEGEGKISKKHFPTLLSLHKKEEGPEDAEEFFNESEIDKLSVLRDNYFRMDISEELLGFRSGSHTLSHYLRGMSLKALSHVHWELDRASKLIVGPSLNGKTQALIKTKMQGYIKNIATKKSDNNEDILFRNLPKEYHKFLHSAIQNFN